jgi:butyryl-CoA dehydrogenase
MALVLYCAKLVDLAACAGDEAQRRDAELLLDVLTPIAKTWPSEHGIESTSLAIQVLGGYGYSPEYPVERYFRDQRLNPIHEGTTGIQGIDLLGRKVRMQGGAGLRLALDTIARDVERIGMGTALAAEAAQLSAACGALASVTRTLLEAQIDLGPDRALAESTAYLDAFGTIVVAWRWLVVAERAEALPAGDFAAGKLAACRYFFRYDLPVAELTLARLGKLDDLIFTVRPEML